MKVLANVLATLGLVALSYWGIEFVNARLYQAREMRRFRVEPQAEVRPDRSPSQPNSGALPVRPQPANGSAIAMLSIPRLGLSAIVVEGAEERELKLGPGHISGTSYPGDGGNVGVAGHRDTFFRPLRFIRKDDTIKVTTAGREYQYKVVSTEIVRPDEVRVLYATGHETLTLVTCYPFDFVGSAPTRFIVRADFVKGQSSRQVGMSAGPGGQ